MRGEWWNTPTTAWAFMLMGLGAGVVLAFVVPSPRDGILIGIVIVLFGLFLLVRSYRIKGQPKPNLIPFPNRELLIKAIATVKEKAITVKMQQDRLNFKLKRKQDWQEELYKRDDDWFAYLEATKCLETQRLIAGDPYKDTILLFLSFVNYHIGDCMGHLTFANKPEPLKTIPFMDELDKRIEQAIRDLDTISLQVLDKGGSQN